MKPFNSAAVLSIGTELTRGELINSNAAWLAEELTALGFEVTEHVTVDDDIGRIEQAVRVLAARHRVVVATGGLGPTTDDVTTEAFARALDVGLVRHASSLERIQAFFAARGRSMSPSNAKQADFPKGAEVLANDTGTAPGFAASLGGCGLFVMPGVPREMRHIFSERIAPRLAGSVTRNSHQVHLRTFGMPESELGERLHGIEQAFPGITLGYRASFPEIEVKVLARASDEPAARELALRAAEAVRMRLGEIVFGGREDSFASVTARLARQAGASLAVADACSGGMLGMLLGAENVPFSYFSGEVHGALGDLLGVVRARFPLAGAASSDLAKAMADGLLRVSGADIAVAVIAVAQSVDDRPNLSGGTIFIAGATRHGFSIDNAVSFSGSAPERIKTNSAYQAMKVLQQLALAAPN